jgi:uncharacterized protein (TIGR03083 family)
MTKEAVDALRSEHAAIVGMAEGWGPDEWKAQSACEGWTVKDVLTHMTTTFQSVVDPASLPEVDGSLPFERQLHERALALSDLSTDEVVTRYRDLGKQATDALEGLQALDAPIDVPSLGTYPMHLLANAFAFDAYTHLRADLLKPRGPLVAEAPPATDAHFNASMDWMFAGMPQMSAATLEPITDTINLTIEGPAARTVNVTAGKVEDGASPGAAATIKTTAADFVLWATKRESPEGLITIEGDEAAGMRFAQALHIF